MGPRHCVCRNEALHESRKSLQAGLDGLMQWAHEWSSRRGVLSKLRTERVDLGRRGGPEESFDEAFARLAVQLSS